jgi:hypothetical protein
MDDAEAARSNGRAKPVRPVQRTRWWWLAISPAVGLGLVWLVITTPPAFYRAAAVTGPEAAGAAGRFVTSLAAIATASRQEGPWGVDMQERDINAWLGTDLPRNHPDLLNGSAWGRLSRPRVRLEPKLARIGIEVSTWGITAVAWADVEVTMRSANHFVVSIRRAGLGSLPLPRDAVLKECGRRLMQAGLETQMQRFRDRSVLLAVVPDRLAERPTTPNAGPRQPSRRWEVDSLRIDRGSLTLAGTSRPLDRPRPAERTSP